MKIIKFSLRYKLLCFLSIALLILIFGNVNRAIAADDYTPEISMGADGTIQIKITARAATTNIRYRTIGFNVSSKRLESSSYNGLQGWVSPMPSDNKPFYLNLAEDVVTGDIKNGQVTTIFTFSNETVKRTLAPILDLDGISTSTPIYFNAIFETYQLVNGSEKVISTNITSWKDIVTNQGWGDTTVFSQYYNIEKTYYPGKQPNYLCLDYDGGHKSQGSLDTLNIGETLRWDNRVTETITINGKSYNINGYTLIPNISGITIKGITENTIGGGHDKDSIINGTGKVPFGGMTVHIQYTPNKETKANSNTLYYKYNSTLKKVTDLAEKQTGESVSWSTQVISNSPVSIFGSGNAYDLQGYYIEAKNKNSVLKGITSMYRSTGATENDIIKGKATVVDGGLNIYIVYGNGTGPVTPTPPPEATPTPTIPDYSIPEGESVSQPLTPPTATGMIKADVRGAERFVVETGIPTTESLYTQAKSTEYLIGYRFRKEVVVKNYPVTVKKTYTLTWKDFKDPTKTLSESITVSKNYTVKRAGAYWVIDNLDYYTIDNATMYNKALPGGKSIMYPNSSYYSPPQLDISHSSSQSYHIQDPNTTIILSPETLSSSDGSRPALKSEDFSYEANTRLGEMQVRNDTLSFNGSEIMNGSYYTKQTPILNNLAALNQPTQYTGINVLYKPNQIIDPYLENDEYNSTGTITYKNHPKAVNITGPTLSSNILNINNVKVHTPVICDPSISANNKKYVQLIDPKDDYVPLVIDPDPTLNDFTVSISNTGKHSNRVGYYTRDMAWSLRSPGVVSYLAKKDGLYRNEVKFPFDVFRKHASSESTYIPKNTWIMLGFDAPTFYLPMWIDEGDYTVDFRTIAVNAITSEKINIFTEKYANTDPNNYVATNTVKVQVSGRLYGLRIIDISDKREWDEVFHNGFTALKIDGNYVTGVNKTKFSSSYAYDYAVGTRDQYGKETGRLSRFTLPLVNGSHPKWTNIGIMKTGYSVNFNLTTMGSRYGSGDSILIRPKFYYVDAKGKNRKEVDIYYNQNFNGKSHKLVKIGSSLDKSNINVYRTDDLLPTKQWKTMADIFNTNDMDYRSKKANLFTYSKMRIALPFMAYINEGYLNSIKSRGDYPDITDTGLKPVDIMKRKQTWYGEYWLPADIFAVEKGYDVSDYAVKKGITFEESFWLKGGYIIVNFEIVTVDSKGKEILSYTNTNNALNGYCSMWNMENAAPYKVSYNGKAKGSIEFNFEPGDFMIYYTNYSIKDDYDTYIIH